MGKEKVIKKNVYRCLDHPEIRKGETFLTNADDEGFNAIGWKTKRAGTTAYDINGNQLKIPGSYPVFVKSSELEKVGITTDRIYTMLTLERLIAK